MGKLLGGDSGLTSPLGVRPQLTYSEMPSNFAVSDIYPEVLVAQKIGPGIITVCMVEYR